MTILISILGILCLGYYLFLLFLQMDFAVIWLLAGVFLTGLGGVNLWLLEQGRNMPAWAFWPLLLASCGALCLFLAVEGCIVSKMTQQGEENLSYVIVLGAQVKGDHPSRALKRRIVKAAEYLEKNPETKAILSGGQGPGEDMTEAECMRQVLTELGISEDRLILEERSTSTKENLIFSARLAPVKEERVGLITQNFHLYRSLKLANKQGYDSVCGIAAPSEWLYQPHFMVREAFAIVKEKLVGNI